MEKFLTTAGGRITCLRCTARSLRSGLQCLKPALKASRTQKCAHHGGKSTGPKTAEGRARIGAAHLVHGRETNQRRQERAEASLRLAQLEGAMHALEMTRASKTVGRKPSGYWPIRTLDDVERWIAQDALNSAQTVKGGK